MVARPARKRMYRTMQGRMVDIEKLRASNESVRAIGNMNVNARGDVLGPGGRIVKAKEQIMREYYEQPKGRVDDTALKTRRVTIPQKQVSETKIINPQPKQVEGQTTKFKPKEEEVAQPEEKKGIDAALDGIE